MGIFGNFDDFDDIFGRLYNNFNRPVKDMKPFKAFKVDDKGYIIVCNTLGMNKDNLQVHIEREKGRPYPILKIKGETSIERINFTNSVDLGIQLKFDEEIEEVHYEVKDGLTTVYIKLKEEVKEEIKMKYLDDGTDIGW